MKQAADFAAKAGSEEAKRKLAEAQAASAKAKAEVEAKAGAQSEAKVKELEAKLKHMMDEEKLEAQAKQAVVAAKAAGIKHTVAAGETLSHISLKYYKSANHWQEIYEANKDVIGDNPNRIKPGQELVIPGASQD